MAGAGERDLAVQLLLDKQEIYEVILRYCRGIDRLDEELLLSVFHPDAYADFGTLKGLSNFNHLPGYQTHVLLSLDS